MATIQTTANPIIEEGKHSAVNWGAVLAGGVAASALTLLLLAFGAGVGFSVVSASPIRGGSLFDEPWGEQWLGLRNKSRSLSGHSIWLSDKLAATKH
jgi:hypothetical protein